jgi:hypothetical protein
MKGKSIVWFTAFMGTAFGLIAGMLIVSCASSDNDAWSNGYEIGKLAGIRAERDSGQQALDQLNAANQQKPTSAVGTNDVAKCPDELPCKHCCPQPEEKWARIIRVKERPLPGRIEMWPDHASARCPLCGHEFSYWRDSRAMEESARRCPGK